MPTASALCQARKRLGEAPVKELFDRVCQPLATTATIVAAEIGPAKTGRENWPLAICSLLSRACWCISIAASTPTSFTGKQYRPAPMLFRMRADIKLPVLARPADDSYLSVITPARIAAPQTLSHAEAAVTEGKAVIVREVDYQVTDREDAPTYRIATSITDWREVLSGDLATAYGPADFPPSPHR